MIGAMRLVLLFSLSACNLVFPRRDGDVPVDATVTDSPRGTDGGPDDQLIFDLSFDGADQLADSQHHTVECLESCGQPVGDRHREQKALAFNGTSHCLVVQPAADLDANPLTISLWALSSALITAPSNTVFARTLTEEASDDTTYRITTDDGNWSVQAAGAQALEALASNRWHHVAITTRPQNNDVVIYLDGIRSPSQTNDDSIALHYTNDPITIGCRVGANGPGEFFEGAIDDVKLFSRVLSVLEIAELAKLD